MRTVKNEKITVYLFYKWQRPDINKNDKTVFLKFWQIFNFGKLRIKIKILKVKLVTGNTLF